MKTNDIVPKLKLVAVLVLAVLAIVLIFQNTQSVVTQLLFVTVSMPLAALLALTLLIGLTGGVLVALKIGNLQGPRSVEK